MITLYSKIAPTDGYKHPRGSKHLPWNKAAKEITFSAKFAGSFDRRIKSLVLEDLLRTGGKNAVQLIREQIKKEMQMSINKLKREVLSLENDNKNLQKLLDHQAKKTKEDSMLILRLGRTIERLRFQNSEMKSILENDFNTVVTYIE